MNKSFSQWARENPEQVKGFDLCKELLLKSLAIEGNYKPKIMTYNEAMDKYFKYVEGNILEELWEEFNK